MHRVPTATSDQLRVQLPEAVTAGAPVPLKVTATGAGLIDRSAIIATFTPSLSGGRTVPGPLANRGEGRYTAAVTGLYSVSGKPPTEVSRSPTAVRFGTPMNEQQGRFRGCTSE